MDVHFLDLDGSMTAQTERLCPSSSTCLRDWGPDIRLACSFRRFRRFERVLEKRWPSRDPQIVFYGSGDFHHVSLALLRRLREPVNLVVIDNHPDWMRGVPLLHCGTWVYHAARLSQVAQVFHFGGDVDFDNAYRWLAPWSLLKSGQLRAFPARRQFDRGWANMPHTPLRPAVATPATLPHLRQLLEPFQRTLAARPLYISVDKDVMLPTDAVVNWDSGHLTVGEVADLLAVLIGLARGRLAAMDMIGDWSPVQVSGLFRRLFHWTMHPSLSITAAQAASQNAAINRILLDRVRTSLSVWQAAA